MSTKVEQASSHVLTTATATSSSSSSAGPKNSMLAAKSGFVIPRNKLSGSMVPIFRGGKKAGGSDVVNEESTNQVQRKTKWGPDLTQDAAVRKGRAVAYQTRVDQITQQLKSRILEREENLDPPATSQISDPEPSSRQINKEKSEFLELERREAIGEILKLNPSYKVPADYKPLLKESKVPIPIKEYPGYNFIGLIFGPATDTQKRLEKETGSKVRVYGTKADSGEKVEISSSDGNEVHGSYEELYVHVSADTYEKVDAALSLIELLVTPVSINPVASTTSNAIAGDNVHAFNLSQGTPTPFTDPSAVVNNGLAQPIIGSAPAPPQGQFQPYQGPWYPTGPPLTPIHPPSGFSTSANPSAPLLSNPLQVSSAPFNPSNMPSLFGPRPVLAAGFGSGHQNLSPFPFGLQPQQQVLQHPYMSQAPPLGHTGPPRNPPMPVLQSLPAQPNVSASLPFSLNQPMLQGPSQIGRPLESSLSQSASLATIPNRPFTPSGSSIGWSPALSGTPASIGPTNMVRVNPPTLSPHGHHPVASQTVTGSGGPPLNISANNMISPISWSSTPPISGHPMFAPSFTSVTQPQVGFSPPLPSPPPAPIQSSPMVPMQPIMARTTVPNLSPNPMFGSAPIPSPVASSTSTPPPLSGVASSVSGSAPTFTAIQPSSLTAPKPQRPSSSDFTFQPHRPQSPAQVVPRPGNQLAPQNAPPMSQTGQPPQVPQNLPFRPAMHNSNPVPVLHDFQRPPVNNHAFAGNPSVPPAAVRHPGFRNPGPVLSSAPVPQMMNFSPSPQMVSSTGSFPPRLGNPVQLQQTYPGTASRPQGLVAPNQQFRGNISFMSAKPSSSPSGGPQIYDPFSPTSVSRNPHLGGGNPANVKRQESDPEYDDLMASVGVK